MMRYFPEDAKIVEYADGAIVVGLYEYVDGAPCAIAYKGKAKKPFAHYRYRNAERRALAVEEWVKSYEAELARKEARKIEKKEATKAAAEAVKIGDVFSASWGYDQTNVDYYEVVGKRGSMVDLREIGLISVEGGGCDMCDYVVPAKGHYISDEIITKRIMCAGKGCSPYVKFSGFNDASLDDCKPQYRSWYA